MQSTENVLKVMRSRGEQGKPLERLYRQLYNPEMYELAYSKIYANRGSITRGTSEETLDGMSKKRMKDVIQRVKTGEYKWQPVRRVYIPKRDGKSRPLGIPEGNDKLLQATMKVLLESYYEPQFSSRSHGFRPERGCHTALREITVMHKGSSWFIEGDIKGCFDNIDHEILMEIMGEKVKDNRFLKLVRHLLKSGYMEDWTYNETLSGTPQGGVISPLLTNIYLDVFDKWVEKDLMPRYNRSERGNGRKRNPEYQHLLYEQRKARKQGDKKTAKEMRKKMKTMPSIVIHDETYRRLEYIRYADDFLLSFAGPKCEAEEIKEEIREFLKDRLNLEMSKEKTLITHAKNEKARFLGHDIKIMLSEEKPSVNGNLWFGVPREVITKAMKKYSRNGKAIHRPEHLERSDYHVVSTFQSEYRGLVEFYSMAHNISKFSRLYWKARGSLLKTLAAKHKTSRMKMLRKYATTETVKGKPYKVIQVEMKREGKRTLRTHFGGIPLSRNPKPYQITDIDGRPKFNPRSEILNRLNAENCEMCGEKGPVEMHHVRGLKDLRKPGKRPATGWEMEMAAMRRKTLATCSECHKAITYGKYLQAWDMYKRRANTMLSKDQSV
jgi:group II intron reverse transcriptase/maturase